MEKLVMNYLNTDLICYRADNPEELVKRQDDIWQPWVEWFDDKYKAKLQTTSGLAALKQDDKIHEALAQHIREMDDDRFTILQMLTPASGSIILAVAFVEGDAGEDDILNSAFLEENYKYDLYNEDLHGGDPLTEKKKKALKADLLAAKAYLDALD
jgi:chaperone required for assembly of F1-ATPase